MAAKRPAVRVTITTTVNLGEGEKYLNLLKRTGWLISNNKCPMAKVAVVKVDGDTP
jgi:hypothetical protein